MSTVNPLRAASPIAAAIRRFCKPSRALTSGLASPRTTWPKCSIWRLSGSSRVMSATQTWNGLNHDRSSAFA